MESTDFVRSLLKRDGEHRLQLFAEGPVTGLDRRGVGLGQPPLSLTSFLTMGGAERVAL